MQTLSQTIIDNVSEEYISTYLNSKKIKYTEEEQGLDLKHRMDVLLRLEKINIQDFHNFLFEELFYGKRKLIRVYKLDSLNRIKTADVWLDIMKDKYNIDSLVYNDILNVIPNVEDSLRIAAIESETDYRGQMKKIKILFVKFIQIRDDGRIKDSSLYFPVEIDFKKKRMFIKTWNRNGLFENHRINELLNDIQHRMSTAFGVNTKVYHLEHKKVLYNMSQGLISDIYEKVPAYAEIERLASTVEVFEQQVLNVLSLKNKINIDNKNRLPMEVIDFTDEIYKILEKVVVSDYFHDIEYEEIWNMGVDTIISRIRFNDTERVLTSLSGEASELPIFCTKTFLALKKSMEDSRFVEKLWIAKTREKGRLSLKYDATNDEYLDILILSQIRYNQNDLNMIMEIYENYGTNLTGTVEEQNQRNAV